MRTQTTPRKTSRPRVSARKSSPDKSARIVGKSLTQTEHGRPEISAVAQKYTVADIARRTIERRAVEAVIWGIPAVNTDLMLQAMLNKTKGKLHEVLYWSRPLDWKNQTLTPNPDSIYLMTFFNTKGVGPVVLDVPPATGGSFAANIVDVWQMPLEDAGPAGADKGKGGKYLLVPPGYTGKLPKGYIVLHLDVYSGYALFRSNLMSHSNADVATSVAYGKRLKVYPLSQATKPRRARFTDAYGVLFDSTIRYDLSFFKSLDRVVQNEPWLQRDRAMIDQLKSIGIEKGQPFNPDAKTQSILKTAIREAHASLEQRYDRGFPPFWPGSRWGLPALPELSRQHSLPMQIRAPTPSMQEDSPTRTRTSASSASAQPSST